MRRYKTDCFICHGETRWRKGSTKPIDCCSRCLRESKTKQYKENLNKPERENCLTRPLIKRGLN